MKSRAAVFVEHGKPLAVDEVDIPDPNPDQVLVKLFSSGVCHSQLHQIHNPQAQGPMLLGHEGTGVVVAKGRDVHHVKEGDHAIVTWVRRDGRRGPMRPEATGTMYREKPASGNVYTWAEHVLTSEQYVVPIAQDVPTDITCIIGCAVLTGAGAVLHTAKVRPGESVAVFGVGGVGLSAISAAAVLSAYPIIAVDLADEKLEFAKKFGATHGVNASKEDAVARVQEITNGGADYAFDAIGVRATMEQILPATRPGGSGADNIGGMAVLIGVPQTPATLDARLLLMGQRIYRASLGATRPEDDFPMYIRWWQEGKLKLDELVTSRYKLDEINDAVHALEQGRVFGRAILQY